MKLLSGKGLRAQAAMEFLMTYGWALLVVIIVIAALAFFGLLNPSKFLPERCDIAPGLTCMDFNARTNSTGAIDGCGVGSNITILLNNGLGQPILNYAINITMCNVTATSCLEDGTTPGVGGRLQTGGVIPEATTQQIIYLCPGMPPNSRFKSDIVFQYNVTVEGQTITHIKKGNIIVQAEKYA